MILFPSLDSSIERPNHRISLENKIIEKNGYPAFLHFQFFRSILRGVKRVRFPGETQIEEDLTNVTYIWSYKWSMCMLRS